MSDFGDAVQEMREGGKVRRQGWKGKYLELVGGMIIFKSDQGYYTEWLAINSNDDGIVDDLLANDWEGID